MTTPSEATCAPARPRVVVLGVSFDVVDLDGATAAVQRLAATPQPHLVVTANPEAVIAAQHDPALARAMAGASLVVADGIGVVWASRRSGRPLPARVPGIELLDRLLAEAAREAAPVFFLGGAPGVAEAAAIASAARHPGLVVAGTHHGFFRHDSGDEAAVVARIRAARSVYLFAGLGMPLQEKWLHRHLASSGVAVAMGVGGSLDVLSGRVPRAPRWIHRLHAEWLYRLLRQPSRWRRQLALLRFVTLVLRRRGKANP